MTSGGFSGPGTLAPSTGRPPFSLVLGITMTGIMGNVLITPALPDIAADLHAATSSAGLLVAASTAPGIVLAPVIGVLADRFGRRAVLVPCLALFGLAGGLGGLAPSFGVLLVLRLLQGVGSAGLINLGVVIITDHWQGAERARMIGRNAAALTASLVVLPPIGGLLASVGGWRATFLPYWLGLVTAAVVLARLPASTRRPGSLASQLRGTAPALRSSRVLAPMALGAGVFVLIFGVLTTTPVYLEAAFGLPAASRGLLLGLPALTSTAAALSLGRLAPRLGRARLILVGLGCFAAGLAVVAVGARLAAVVVGLLFYGLGEGLLIATLQETVASAAPPDSRATVVATWVGFARAGQTAGPVLAGAGVAGLGARPTFGLGAVVAVMLAGLARGLGVGAGPAASAGEAAVADPPAPVGHRGD